MKSPAIKKAPGFPLLLTPGPVLLNESARKALSLPMSHHRSAEFKRILKQTAGLLKEIFQTKEPVLILNSSGTGAMEAGLANILSPNEETLCVCAGKFGRRWRDIALAFGLKAHSIDLPPGAAVRPSAVEEALKKHKKIRAVFVSACETSSATEHPIKAIAGVMKKRPHVLFAVDGVTGLGAMDLPMDKWGIDVLLAGSQKSFMLPAGLSFIALSKKAWKAAESASLPKYYFDLKKEREAQLLGQTAFSSSVTLIRALKQSLSFIKKRGLKTCVSNCRVLKESSLAFCGALGLSLLSSRPANAVTAFLAPKKLSADRLKERLRKNHGIFLAGGQGALKGRILRLGHLGPLRPSDHLRGLRALAFELNKADPLAFDAQKTKKALKKAQEILKGWKAGG